MQVTVAWMAERVSGAQTEFRKSGRVSVRESPFPWPAPFSVVDGSRRVVRRKGWSGEPKARALAP